jgi:hypothetical protein
MDEMDYGGHRQPGDGGVKVEDDEEYGLLGGRTSVKRARPMFVGDSDEDEFGGSLGADEESEMLALAESATRDQMSERRTWQRPEADEFTTPSAQRTHDVLHGMATPHTATVGRNRLLIAAEQREPETKRQKLDLPSTPSHPVSASSSGTLRALSAEQPTPGAAGVDDYPITEEILALLGRVPMLDDDVMTNVRRKLNDYALRVKGIERGRDMVRTLVKGKDAKIAELQARVAQLEQQRTADRERIKTLASLVKDMS